jgi:hypothetical protein
LLFCVVLPRRIPIGTASSSKESQHVLAERRNAVHSDFPLHGVLTKIAQTGAVPVRRLEMPLLWPACNGINAGRTTRTGSRRTAELCRQQGEPVHRPGPTFGNHRLTFASLRRSAMLAIFSALSHASVNL